MADPLDPDARALWQRVVDTVRPLPGRRRPSAPKTALATPAPPAATPVAQRPAARPAPRLHPVAATLDGGWDRRLARGIAQPDMTIDLHGHTLASAHAALEAGLARAVARGARLVLLVAGKAPPPGRSRLDNPLRGVIRASVTDWLDHSRHAGAIAAIRPAHPRHGGTGALYLILRRAR